MKLRFSVEPKDLVIFAIFCVMLLYLVAIVELNVISFAGDSTFHGFNPFPAFSSELFAPTMVFFIIVLITVIASVSNYFWERESGFGLTMGKKEKSGYSRWAKDSEIKKQLKMIDPKADSINYAGVPLVNDGKNIWVDDGEFHSLIIGATGSGKTEMIVQPLVSVLAKKGESMIVTDPKGEIYERNGELLREKGYNIVVLNFRNPQNGNAWNPLTLPLDLYTSANQDKAVELLEDLGTNIVHEKQTDDPFWQNSGGDFLTGLALGLFEDAKREEINLNSINLMANSAEEKFAGTKLLNAYFGFKNPASSAYVNASTTINAPNETKGSILSVFKSKIKLFASRENLSEMLSHSDFDMRDIGRKKTAVFIIVQDEKSTYHSLVTIFIKQCYETLIDVAQENGGKLEYRTNFILDEFANMPPLKDISTMITAARSRRIRMNFIIQNFAQLEGVYGKQVADTIKGNCGNIIYLISSELAALEEISKLCGEKESKKDDKTASTPLITVSDLQRIPMWTLITLRSRQMPFKSKAVPYFKMDSDGKWGKHYPKMEYPSRKKQPVELFNIKNFVESKHAAKMQELFGNVDGGANPMPPFDRKMANDLNSSVPSNIMPTAKPVKDESSSFNMDKILKNINERLAEIDAEEEKENKVTPKPIIEKEKIDEVEQLNPIIEKEIIDEVEQLEPIVEEEKIDEVEQLKPIIEEAKIKDDKKESNKASKEKKAPVKKESKNKKDKESAPKKNTDSKKKDQSNGKAKKEKSTSKVDKKTKKEMVALANIPEVPFIDETEEKSIKTADIVETIKETETKPYEENYTNKYIPITDDQFFDDFFNDETE